MAKHERGKHKKESDIRKRRPLRTTMKSAGLALAGMAVIKELRLPSGERTWHGELFEFVPYDLRPPTLGRLRAAWWNPEDDRLFTPRPVGVGWGVNFARLWGAIRAQ